MYSSTISFPVYEKSNLNLQLFNNLSDKVLTGKLVPLGALTEI